jgi:hypothetical protein
MENPEAALEAALIVEYLREHGYCMAEMRELPPEQCKQIMTEAVRYASARLTEVGTRARFMRTIHGGGLPVS